LLVATTIWWLLFWTVFGLCIGSFLNVVIHRLPRNQSLRDPLWSYCPNCLHQIRWYDNLPVASFIWLGGKCRDCRTPISTRYPLVEMLTALVVLAVFDAFFVARTRVGLCDEPYLTWSLAEDWPVFLAHAALFACLLAMAAIDLREYWVDVRFTAVATWFGLVLHTIWTPDHSLARGPRHAGWLRPGDATAAGAIGAMVGLGVVWLVLRRQRQRESDPDLEQSPLSDAVEAAVGPEEHQLEFVPPSELSDPALAEDADDPAAASLTAAVPPALQSAGVVAVGVVLLATMILMGVNAIGAPTAPVQTWRSLAPILLVFALILAEAHVPRQADHEIMEAIEAERFSARRMALGELALLLPAIGLGAAAVWLARGDGGSGWAGLLHWTPGGTAWQPFYGLSTAAAGYVIGGGIGWAVRIIFTAAFGKEAFGLGDIHMMAAAGCVAGWPVVLLGFLVTIFVALFAWLVMLPFKRTRAIPLVPWLALGYLVVVIHYQRLLALPPVRNTIEVVNMLVADKSQPLTPGAPL